MRLLICNFLHIPFSSFLLFSSTLFSNINLRSLLRVRD
jgi:hypothetical protein